MGPDRDQSMPLLVVADNESQLGVPSGAALVVHLPGVRRQQATSIVVADLRRRATTTLLNFGNSGGLNLPIHLVADLQLEVVWVGGRRLLHHVVVQDFSSRIVLLAPPAPGRQSW